VPLREILRSIFSLERITAGFADRSDEMTEPIKICVIDDEQIVCERLRPALEKSGFEVETFTNSASALTRLSEKKFDIVITDIKMGQPDGIEILRYAKAHSPDTRVIMITGFATADTAREAMKSGAVDFIAKPFRLSKLKDLVLKIASEIQDQRQA
jgi:DNA-binding NtrC family response regulator